MKKYYIRGQEVSKEKWDSLHGDKELSPYIKRLYRNEILLEDIPGEKRQAVQTIVNNRIAEYGAYEDRPLSVAELNQLISSFCKKQITRAEAKALFENLEKMRQLIPDSIASETADIYPKLTNNGQLIQAGDRINWNGTIMRAKVSLWDTENNNPDNAPGLWGKINYKQGHRIIPEVISADAAFSKDEMGWWNNILYASLIDANVWNPDLYPAGWEKLYEEE